MTVIRDELKIFRGERKTWAGTVTERTGAAVDITSASIYFTVRSSIPAGTISDDTDADVLFKKTVGSGITLSGPTVGKFEILVDKADTNTLEIPASGKSYLYEISIVESGQTDPRTLAKSTLTVLSDIVRGV